MKTKYLLVALVILFLVFIGIWIVSPRVGEKVETDTGIGIEFGENDDELPESVPAGYIRDKNFVDAVVYRKDNGDGTITFYEYVGDGQFTYYDINKPSYLVRTDFDRGIYQIKDTNGTLRKEYRALDGNGTWQVVSADYKQIFTIPKDYMLSTIYPNLYKIKSGTDETPVYEYKMLTKIGETYAWVSPTETSNWISTEIPSTFAKTDIVNVYKSTQGETPIYKKVLTFNDSFQSIVVIDCDESGKFL